MKKLRLWTEQHRAATAALLVFLPVLCGLCCLCFGRMEITPREVLSCLGDRIAGRAYPDTRVDSMVFNNRLPRVLLALCVGGGLSAAGAAFQSLFSNPLATPDTLGVASGASFGAALGLLLGMNMIGVQLAALVCGLGAVGLTFGLSRGKNSTQVTVVLCGVVLSSLFSALVSLVKYVADVDSQLPAITYWLMGTLSGTGWKRLAVGLPLMLAGAVLLLLLRWRLNLLTLTDDEAKACGADITLLRGVTALCAACITASAVSMCGQVGWVGLLVPHICRMAVGSDNSRLIPASLCVGAGFLTVVDTLARSATAAELPISILTAIIGAPFFVALLRRTGGWRL